MSRVYRDIMEEVVQKLEESEVEPRVIHLLKKRWFEHLHDKIQNYDQNEEPEIVEESASDSDEENILGKNTKNFMICLYEKVTKNKHKFRTTLKQGFINIGPEDYAFSCATGDLDW